MKEYAVLAEDKLGEWKVLLVCGSEEEAREKASEAWKTTDAWGYCLYHSVLVFERSMA